VHGQFVTVNVVLPDTVAVNVCTCPTITVAADGLTVTVTTFTLELLHPPKSTAVHANATTALFTILRHSITHFSLTLVPRVSPAHLVAESRLMNLIMVLASLARRSILPLAHPPDCFFAASFTIFPTPTPFRKGPPSRPLARTSGSP